MEFDMDTVELRRFGGLAVGNNGSYCDILEMEPFKSLINSIFVSIC